MLKLQKQPILETDVLSLNSERLSTKEHLRQAKIISSDCLEGIVAYFTNLERLVLVLDFEGVVIQANSSLCRFLGVKETDLVGQNWFDIYIDVADKAILSQEFKKFVGNELSWLGEHDNALVLPSGEKRLVSWENSLLDKDGAVGAVLAVGTDVSRSRLEQKGIEGERKLFRAIFAFSPEAMYVRTLNGEVVEANDAALALLGYVREEVLGKKIVELGIESSSDLEKVNSEVERKDGELREHQVEVELMRKRGDRFPALLQVSRVDFGGEMMVMGIIRDQSIALDTFSALKQFKQAIEQSGDVVMMTDLKGTLTYVNPEFSRFYGYSFDEVVGKKHPGILREGGMSFKQLMEYGDVLLGGKTLHQQFKNITKDGKHVEVISSSSAIRNENGRAVGALIVQQDITKHQLVEQKLDQLSLATEQSPASVVITDLEGSIEYVNARFEKVTGYFRDEVLGKNPRILKSGQTPAKTYEEMWSYLVQGKEWRGELINKKKNGEIYWEDARISPIIDRKTGKATHYLAVKQDVTEDKQQHFDQEKTRERLEIQRRSLVAMGSLVMEDNFNLAAVIKKVLELAHEAIQVERLSCWMLNEQTKQLELLDLYDPLRQTHQAGEVLAYDRIAQYLIAIRSHRAVEVADVTIDERTKEFSAYFDEYKIASLLDAPIRKGGNAVGVMSFETTQKREWTVDEVRYAGEVADQLAQILTYNDQQQVEQMLRNRSKDLERMNKILVGRELRMMELKKENQRLREGKRE